MIKAGAPTGSQEGNSPDPYFGRRLLHFDARTYAPELPIPFYLIQGRDDHVVSFQAASALNGVPVSAKEFIPIDGGHFACFTDDEGNLCHNRLPEPVATRHGL
jgi:fermentation-respiration switch protein FrsA (DUF1100 family)